MALPETIGAPPASSIDWREYYYAVRENFWVVLLCLVLGAIGAAIFMSRQDARFQARSVIFLEQEQDRVLKDVRSVREEQVASLDMINTIADLVSGFSFAHRVTERMKLNEDPHFLAALPAIGAREVSTAEAADALRGMVVVQYRRNTRLVDILLTHSDPAVAVSLANNYADEYLRYVLEKRLEASKSAQEFLLEESERLRRKMRVSEESMQSFRERERTPSLEKVQETMQAKLTELSRQMAEMEQKLSQMDTDLRVARANAGKADELLRLPSVAAEPKVLRLTTAIGDQERELLLLSQRYRAKHPAYIAARTQHESLIKERDSVLQDVVSLLETGREHLQTQYDVAKKAREEQEGSLLGMTGKSVEYNDLKRELEKDSAMYDSVLQRIKEIDVTKGLTGSPVRVHERAAGAKAIGVTAARVYTMGCLLGLVLGLALVLGRHYFDQSIKTVEQVEQITGLPVLAAVPKRKSKAQVDERSLDSVADPQGLVAESFRSLRASLSMLANADTRRTFLITSALPSDGKTFCSSNFAVTLSQLGLKTLLIDADLRRPTISKTFFGKPRNPGLGEVLSGQIPLEEAIVTTGIENLSVLTAGGRAPNPAELLAGRKMPEILSKALASYDRIVIDTAPALAVSDALLVAPHADVTCLVVRSFVTPRKTVTRAVRALTEINCRPAGILLNCLPSSAGSYHYYSGKYSGSYATKGVYGARA